MNKFNNHIVESERLIFRPISASHLSQRYVDWMNDSEVTKFLESGGDYTLKKLKIFLSEQELKQNYMWAIHIKITNKHIGNIKIDPKVSLGPLKFRKNCCQLGILIGDKNQWSKGYAYEASKRIIDFCFDNLGFKRIVLGVKMSNLFAIKLYKKLGFDFFERDENPKIYIGIPDDAIIMGLINEK